MNEVEMCIKCKDGYTLNNNKECVDNELCKEINEETECLECYRGHSFDEKGICRENIYCNKMKDGFCTKVLKDTQ